MYGVGVLTHSILISKNIEMCVFTINYIFLYKFKKIWEGLCQSGGPSLMSKVETVGNYLAWASSLAGKLLT